ncbi:Type I secretion outer membrane protein, TolC precursor [Rhodovastum atsumiense]|uniref:TolC family outer membrane protein n=1 Tax=Rhodovastum atsumiense TaxID=504468 RepID=A0A5M6IMB5_9PROT|nr:TolC family outer membrane protein [Rhodovastum atsumiense]KAA5608688.1 TolC family outer membrane protein [Rhodovastum atsumiense]CAH2599101.1 Type I secretion outer membrane protein, TolC precursor [Rhodovastum atsumiense]
MLLRSGLAIGIAIGLVGPAAAETRTLQEALATTYANNPSLQAARAQLRSVDENVPQALAGWRPQVSFTANAGYVDGHNYQRAQGQTFRSNVARGTNTEQLQLTQPLYRGGQTRAGTNRAENQVMAQRARLIASEQQVFTDTINAFVQVIANQQVLALNINNEQVLSRQLQATNDRFRVGEITRTDVAQAEAALAGATAQRQTSEGNLQTARAQYQRLVGELPGALIEPQPLRLPVRGIDEAKAVAAANNPAVVAALFDESAAKDNFDLQYARLMPNVSLQGTVARAEDVTQKDLTNKYGEILATLTVPIYQGGSEYSAIRQARQQQQQARKTVDDARRTAVQQLIASWETYNSARSTIESTRAQIRSNQIALEGVQREAIVGSRTTLDVLNAEQALLNSRVTLVQNLANLVTASYSVAAAVGRLTARDLNLNVPLYDDAAYYRAVRDRWIGTGDYATNQPGR